MVTSIHYLIGLDLAPHAATIACSTMELSTNARVGYLHFFYFHILLFDFGEVSGFTRCDFVGKDGITRTKWVIPDALKKNAYLKDWKYPASHSKIPCILHILILYNYILIYEVGSTAAAAGGAEAVKDEPEVDDKTPEDEVPVGQEMYPRYSLDKFLRLVEGLVWLLLWPEPRRTWECHRTNLPHSSKSMVVR